MSALGPPLDVAPDWTPRKDAEEADHDHVWRFVRTNENWFDGDEVDIYECDCGACDKRYIPR